MTDLLVGVDVGTTRLKVGVFSRDGNLLAFGQRKCAPDYLSGGRVEVSADLWWSAFEEAFEECLGQADCSAIRAIGVSSQAQTYVLLNQDDRPLGPAISWLDTRGDAGGTAQKLAGHDYYAHTGWPAPDPMFASCKLRALNGKEGGWTGVARLLFADGYLMFRLTESTGVSRNLAAMSGLYSQVLNDWWPEALAAARVPRELLPALHDMGEAVCELDAALAEEWGIPGVPVVAGANDQTAAALGAGLSGPERTLLGLGTAMPAYQVIPASAGPLASKPLRGPYPGGLNYQLHCYSSGGAVVEWARELFAPSSAWDEFFAQALSAEAGCAGLRVNPYFINGGAMAGLTLSAGRKEIARAVLEAVACAAREMLDSLSAPNQVRVTGGGAADDGWMQLLADVTGRTLERLDQPQAGLWGTALLAGHGAGLFSDVLATVRSQQIKITPFAPNPALRELYDQVYQDILGMKPRNVSHKENENG